MARNQSMVLSQGQMLVLPHDQQRPKLQLRSSVYILLNLLLYIESFHILLALLLKRTEVLKIICWEWGVQYVDGKLEGRGGGLTW